MKLFSGCSEIYLKGRSEAELPVVRSGDLRAPAFGKDAFLDTAERVDRHCSALDDHWWITLAMLEGLCVLCGSIKASPWCEGTFKGTEGYRRSCRNTSACCSSIRKEVMRLKKNNPYLLFLFYLKDRSSFDTLKISTWK